MTSGVWTSYHVDLSPDDMVREFARSGWTHLELSDEHAAALLRQGEPGAVGEAFRMRAEDQGIRFPQGHLKLDADVTAESGEPLLSALKRWLDLFVAAGVRCGVIHPGGRPTSSPGEADGAARRVHEARVRAFSSLCEHVRGSELTICLENVSSAPAVDDLLQVIGDVGSRRLGICLDTGHLNLASRDQLSFIERAGPLLRALHLADNDGTRDQHLIPFGLGTVDWEGVCLGLARVRYRGLLNFEIPGERKAPMALRRAKLDYLRQVAAHLADRIASH
jgi:sugar phosphate isomerase/epimerase